MTFVTGRRTGQRIMRGALAEYFQIIYDAFGTITEFTVHDADDIIYQRIQEHITPHTLRAMSGDKWIAAIGQAKERGTSAYKYHVTQYGENRILDYRKSLERRQRRGYV